MLAYVFWHAPSDRAAIGDYEIQLLQFHRMLAAAGVDGFAGSQSVRVSSLPWMPGENYEDWYLLADSGGLDRLNDAAVRGDAKPPHDLLARKAGWGTGGLYRHRLGPSGFGATQALWFMKPPGMTYSQLDTLVAPILPDSGSLWQRQLTLGPGYEYCILASRDLEVPESLSAVRVSREVLRQR
jgi:hypothetical protein